MQWIILLCRLCPQAFTCLAILVSLSSFFFFLQSQYCSSFVLLSWIRAPSVFLSTTVAWNTLHLKKTQSEYLRNVAWNMHFYAHDQDWKQNSDPGHFWSGTLLPTYHFVSHCDCRTWDEPKLASTVSYSSLSLHSASFSSVQSISSSSPFGIPTDMASVMLINEFPWKKELQW